MDQASVTAREKPSAMAILSTSSSGVSSSQAAGAVVAVPARFKKVDGILTLTSDHRLLWASNDADGLAALVIELSDIESQQQSNGTKIMLRILLHSGTAHTFSFTSPPDRDAVRDAIVAFLAAALARTNAPAVAKTSRPTTDATASQSSNGDLAQFTTLPLKDEVELRSMLLKQHRHLSRAHQAMVRGGLLSETEFWSKHKRLLETAAVTKKQQRGPVSAWLSDVRPVTNEGKEVKYVLTPQIIHSIFVQYPTVAKLHKEMVPDKLSEPEFWTRYFQSKFFHRTRTVNATTGADDELFEQCWQDAEQSKPSDERVDRLNPMLNLAATEMDKVEENGNAPDMTMQYSDKNKAIPIIRRFNRHSEQVLHSFLAAQQQQKPSAHPPRTSAVSPAHLDAEIDLEDLHAPRHRDEIPLAIHDHPHTMVSRASVASAAPVRRDDVHRFVDAVRDVRLDVGASIVDRQCRHAQARIMQSVRDQAAAAPVGSLKEMAMAPTTAHELEAMFATTTELLRHFWGALRTDADKQKRMLEALRGHRATVTKWQSRAAGSVAVGGHSAAVTDGVCDQMVTLMDRALQHI
ncbi:RNA polymerase II transcription factor B subunit 1 [Allomyces javanicus]|nr:RNA polymerase II transcription factor B subunit 1 [Allomyces javanicus]